MPPMSGERGAENPAAEGRGDTLGRQAVPLESRLDVDEQLLPLRTESESSDKAGPGSSEPQRLKTVVAFAVILLSGFFNFFLLTIIHDVVPRTPLPDLAFMIIEQQPWAAPAGDVAAALSVGVTFSLMLLHKYRWLVFRRLFLIAGFFHLLAAVLQQPLGHLLPEGGEGGDVEHPHAVPGLRHHAGPHLQAGQDPLRGPHVLRPHHLALPHVLHRLSLHPPQVFESPRVGRDKSALSWLWWYWVSVWFEAETGVEGRVPNELEWPLPWPSIAVHTVHRVSHSLNAPDSALPTHHQAGQHR